MSLAWLLIAAAAGLGECDALAARGAAQAQSCYSELALTAADAGVRAEALWRAGNIAGANAAFRQAVAAAPEDAALRSRWGRLFLSVHQDADAGALFREALELDPDDIDARLGLAELSAGRFSARAEEHLSVVLEQAPSHPRAHLLMARLHLTVGNTQAARAPLVELLEEGRLTGRDRLDAYALLAAADHLDGNVPSPWTAKALAQNPRFGDIYAVPAHFYVINRRYREAVALYEQAVAVQPTLWDAHSELGINLLRVNRMEDARAHLERAYEGDPYNALTVNTLRLLDTLDGFETVRRDGLVLRVPAAEAAVLAPYVVALVREARDSMAARYRYAAHGPIVVELYEHHDDFAVRTAGLPGLGILGATFGDVVVMDGPAAKGIDEGFDWASALWHELAHVMTLGATDNRVSRWFSEGVSVLEEWRHGPTERRSVPLYFLTALAEDRLLGVAELDEGFLRPRYPNQVAISYIQAGLVCQLIARRFDTGLADILAAYESGAGSEAAIRAGLGIEPEALDRQFAAYLEQRFGDLVPRLDRFEKALHTAHRAAGAEDWPAAIEAGREALALYPEYVEPDSAYLPLARAAAAVGDTALMTKTLAAYFAAGGRDPWALSRLAEHYQASGRLGEAVAVHRVLVRTVPLDADRHATFGELLSAAGRHDEALKEYRAVLALDPHDKARAHYRIARELHRLERPAEARRSLLYALEIAPRYAPALNLLIEVKKEEVTREEVTREEEKGEPSE